MEQCGTKNTYAMQFSTQSGNDAIGVQPHPTAILEKCIPRMSFKTMFRPTPTCRANPMFLDCWTCS